MPTVVVDGQIAFSESGYRTYDQHSLQKLRFIKKAQTLGFSLEEVRRIISLQGGKETCDCVIGMAEATLSETDLKLKQLRTFRKRLGGKPGALEERSSTESGSGILRSNRGQLKKKAGS